MEAMMRWLVVAMLFAALPAFAGPSPTSKGSGVGVTLAPRSNATRDPGTPTGFGLRGEHGERGGKGGAGTGGNGKGK
jgi:hypothetical protein